MSVAMRDGVNLLLRPDFLSLNRKSFLSEKGEGRWSGFEENIPEGMESTARGTWGVSERVPSPSFSFVISRKSPCSAGLSGELEACDQRPLVQGLPPGRGPKGRASGCCPGDSGKSWSRPPARRPAQCGAQPARIPRALQPRLSRGPGPLPEGARAGRSPQSPQVRGATPPTPSALSLT